jgi:hypothetical protein
MSYDLFLCRPEPGHDPLTYARAWYAKDADLTDEQPSPESRQEMLRLVEALCAAFPELTMGADDGASIEVDGPEETG